MSDSTSVIADLLLTPNTAGQAAKANDLFNAASPAMLYANDPATTTGLTWGYVGGRLGDNDVANGTVALTTAATNYVVAAVATGVVSVSTATTNWDNDTDYLRLYEIVAGASSITSYEDHRQVIGGGSGGAFTGGTLTSALNEAPIVTLASATTTDIGAQIANTISVSGTTTITGLGTIVSGAFRRVHFQGALTLTHNATSLILPTGANITTVADDVAEFVSLGSGNWRCVNYQRKSGAAVAGGGSLTNFTEAVNTSAPNATIPVVSLTATNAATNVDIAFVAKGAGTGSLMAQIPDSTTTGGNKRGSQAVDWQMTRTSAASRVASGLGSAIGGGNNNSATNNYSTVAGGTSNQATGAQASIAGGNTNTASGSNSFVGGGDSNTGSSTGSSVAGGSSNTASTNAYGAVGGGQSNVASGTYSHIPGGQFNAADASGSMASGIYAATKGIIGNQARASGRFSAAGDAQRASLVVRRATTNATPADLTSDANSGGTNNQLILENNEAAFAKVRVVARSSADRAAWEIDALIYRGANAASTTVEGSPSVTQLYGSGGAATWAVAVSADTSNGGLKVTVTGVAATNIKWVASIETVEVVG